MALNTDKAQSWTPPDTWLKISAIDAHTGGEPFRVIVDGFPSLKGETILEMRRDAKDNHDHLRKALMWEPRGHADMYGCLLTPPVSPMADFGILFMHNEGFSTMCGHGIIAITKVVLETGMLPMKPPQTTIRVDTPAGLVTAHATIEHDMVSSVAFHNVPSFVFLQDAEVQVPGLGFIRYDIAFGGAFYAYVNAADVEVNLIRDDFRALIEKGMAIKRAVMADIRLKHPEEEDLNFLYGTIFTGPPLGDEADSRNVCIFAEGEVDRSPTGTGVSGRLALDYARGNLGIDEAFVIESIIGSRFTGRVIEQVRFGNYDAIIPEVSGRASITGRNEFLIDPKDPFQEGFILR